MCIIIFRINKKSIISRNTYEWQKLYWYKNGQKKLTAFWTYFLLTRLSSLSSDNFWCPWRQGNSIRSTIRRVLCSSLFEWRMWVVAVPTWTLTFSSPLFLVPSCICSLLKTICRLPQMEQSMDQHFLCCWIVMQRAVPLVVVVVVVLSGKKERKKEKRRTST